MHLINRVCLIARWYFVFISIVIICFTYVSLSIFAFSWCGLVSLILIICRIHTFSRLSFESDRMNFKQARFTGHGCTYSFYIAHFCHNSFEDMDVLICLWIFGVCPNCMAHVNWYTFVVKIRSASELGRICLTGLDSVCLVKRVEFG